MKQQIGFNKKTKHYTFLLDEERQIYASMACIGCMPSRRPCPIHEKADFEAGKPTLFERLKSK